MTYTGLLYKGIYRKIKETVWRYSHRFYHERNQFYADLLSKVMKELKFLTTSNAYKHYLLDVGCGKGDLTLKMSATLKLKAVSVDLNRGFIPHSKICFIESDGCALPFKPNFFVLVTAFSLIEHIRRDQRDKFYDEVKKSFD